MTSHVRFASSAICAASGIGLLARALMLFAVGATSTARSRPAIPINPVNGILEAFRSHEIVALGEGNHNNEQAHAFRLSLIRDPRFPAVVNDIVVEFGNARYQDV